MDQEEEESGRILHLAFDLPEDKVYVSTLRKTISCLLDGVGVAKSDVEDIELILGELATNVVSHARSDAGYRVGVEWRPDRLWLTVTDQGVGFSPTDLSSPGTERPFEGSPDADKKRFGGWGLPLVSHLADRLEILPRIPHGTTVRVEKRLQPSGA